MTIDEFQTATHEFMTPNKAEAVAMAEKYNALGVDGETIVPTCFGGLWCVMLSGAYQFTKELGI